MSLTFVLHYPQNDLNIGSILRVASNFQIDDLRIVTSRDIDPEIVRITATHSFAKFEFLRIFSNLPDAIADCHHVYATTSRTRTEQLPVITPTAAAQLATAASAHSQRTAFLFGSEDHGLPNEAIDRATAILTIPTSPQYYSLNLAQAVLLVAWELFRASEASSTANAEPQRSLSQAPREQVERMLDSAKVALEQIHFFKYGDGEYVMRALRTIFAKAQLSERELAILFGIFAEVRYVAKKANTDGSDEKE